MGWFRRDKNCVKNYTNLQQGQKHKSHNGSGIKTLTRRIHEETLPRSIRKKRR